MENLLLLQCVLTQHNVPKDIRKVIFDLVFWDQFLLFLQERFRQFVVRRRTLITDQDGVGWEIKFSVGDQERVVVLSPLLIQTCSIDFYLGNPVQLPYILSLGGFYCAKKNYLNQNFLTRMGILEQTIESWGDIYNECLINLHACHACGSKIDHCPKLVTVYFYRAWLGWAFVSFQPYCDDCFENALHENTINSDIDDEWWLNSKCRFEF
jgi:hypothetical protein